jgi:hypothetical protein
LQQLKAILSTVPGLLFENHLAERHLADTTLNSIQGKQTEGEGSVHLTSSLRWLVLLNNEVFKRNNRLSK